MKLAGFELYGYEIPFSSPVVLKGVTLHSRKGLLLRLLGDDESEGWGEAAPLPGFSRESLEEACGQLGDLAASMRGRQISGDWIQPDGALGRELDDLDLAPSARFGLELAVRNLYATSVGKGLRETMGSLQKETLPLNGLLCGTSEAVLADARRMGESGYQAVKLKVGGLSVWEDARLVRDVGCVLGGVSLCLDANRAWGFEEAAEFSRGVSGVAVEYVEEPLAEPARLPELVREYGMPVALDESLVGMLPEELEEHPYARAVVLKPTLLGGISRTLHLAEKARGLGMYPVISSSYESGVGTGALVALAAAVGGRPAGLDTHRRLAGDVLRTPLNLSAPMVSVRETVAGARVVDVRRLELIRRS